MEFSKLIKELSAKALKLCEEPFFNIEKVAEYNQQKMLETFIKCKVSETHINYYSTGYGYSDLGREMLDSVYAAYFGTEDALVRHSFVSGTHALTVSLFSVLRPGDTVLCVTGDVYDTLKSVIGVNSSNNESMGTLKDFGINYEQLNLCSNGKINFKEIKNKIKKETKVVYIQRSKGYSLRSAVSILEIKKVVSIVKSVKKDCTVIVDNCYGEFVEMLEPTEVFADLAVGSLIKNPGGGIATSGGYIAGRKDLIKKCAGRLTVPGVCKDIGASFNIRELFLGFFNAPFVVKEALKVATFASALFSLMGYEVFPKCNDLKSDVVTAIVLKNKEMLIKFCRAIQSYSAVNSFLKLEPWAMPGYSDEIIMASGSFTSGSSIEISADAPLREPYAVYLQGSLNFYSGKVAVLKAAEAVLD